VVHWKTAALCRSGSREAVGESGVRDLGSFTVTNASHGHQTSSKLQCFNVGSATFYILILLSYYSTLPDDTLFYSSLPMCRLCKQRIEVFYLYSCNHFIDVGGPPTTPPRQPPWHQSSTVKSPLTPPRLPLPPHNHATTTFLTMR
jgi:hypothetical protein